MVSTTLKISAQPNPFTRNPGTMAATSKITKAFITQVKSPRVKMLIGKVKNNKIGLIKVLTKPSTIAAPKADQTPTCTPGRIAAEMPIAIVIKIKFPIILIHSTLGNLY